MAISKLTPLPIAMSRQRPENYSAEGDAYFSAVEQKMVPELNATVDGINTAAAVIDNQHAAALIAAQNAAASQAATALTANASPWVSGTTYALNTNVISQVNFQLYRKRTNSSVSNSDPANDGTNWVLVGTGTMPIVTRTSNTALSRDDAGKIIDITSGTFTQTFAAANTLGLGWFVYLTNTGTGDITLDPNGSELIDGLTSFVMYPSEMRLIVCTGTALKSYVVRGFERTFITSGTFVKPPGYNYFEGMLWGAGGSGAKYDGSLHVSGGAGGACSPFSIQAQNFANTESVIIGSGGASVTQTNTVGNPGGFSSLGTLIYSYGGGGGKFSDNAGVAISTGGKPFYPSGDGGVIYNGGFGGLSSTEPTVYGGPGGGGINTSNISGPGGVSIFAGTGGTPSFSGTASQGQAPAAGGGATRTGTSGAGARGELRIRGVV